MLFSKVKILFAFGLESNTFIIHFRTDEKFITIGSGSENMLNLEKRGVVRSVGHPKYNRPKFDYDVGVLKVATPFVVSEVQKPIALVEAGEDAATREPVVVSGWGINRVSICVYPPGNFVESQVQVHLQRSVFEKRHCLLFSFNCRLIFHLYLGNVTQPRTFYDINKGTVYSDEASQG